MKIIVASAMMSLTLGGCTSMNLKNALGTPKNPTSIFSDPTTPGDKPATQDRFIVPLYNVLLEARTGEGNSATLNESGDMRRYLGAGFGLSDIYCTRFFVKTDEAYRRRRFGRTLTNDVGTIMTTVLGLANAGEKVVTGLAGAVGFADSAWRNYDDSFVVSPDLSNIQSLVFAAQDNFRARSLAKDAVLPGDYGTAQSIIQRYANICSFLGMKTLLDQSAAKQKNDLNTDTEKVNRPVPAVVPPDPKTPPVKAPAPAPAVAPVTVRPEIAIPSLAPNKQD